MAPRPAPRCPLPHAGTGAFFFAGLRESGRGRGAPFARAGKAQCPPRPGHPHPRKGKFEKLVIRAGRSRGPSGLQAAGTPGSPPGMAQPPRNGRGPLPQLLPRATGLPEPATWPGVPVPKFQEKQRLPKESCLAPLPTGVDGAGSGACQVEAEYLLSAR